MGSEIFRRAARIVMLCCVILAFCRPAYSTETYMINEIDPAVTRAVFSDQRVIGQIDQLLKKKYVWSGEMVHAGSSKESFYHFDMFFEKKGSPSMLLMFYYDPVQKKVENIRLKKADGHHKRAGSQ